MNYGLYISASGVLTNLYRQDVATNNLANVNTVGYKPDNATFRLRDPARVEDGLPQLDSNELLEKLGAGVLLGPNRIDLRAGPMSHTENPLDLAVMGEGLFVVTSGEGTGAERLRFTRDGRTTLDANGRLVLASNGMAVLDTNDRPIQLDPSLDISIRSDGTIVQDGAEVARIQISMLDDPTKLRKGDGGVMHAPNIEQENRRAATGTVRQGWLELSGVNPTTTLIELTKANKAVAANATMIKYYDQMLSRAVTTLGRVA
jgi:flagellar basal-body rod protein FlgF